MLVRPGPDAWPGLWRQTLPTRSAGSLPELPGEWVRLEPDGWTQMVVCARCGARWLTRLGSFSERTLGRLHEHGRDHLRGSQQARPGI
jgi:hypothetical protein